jgi:hypothetical protein
MTITYPHLSLKTGSCALVFSEACFTVPNIEVTIPHSLILPNIVEYG